VPLGVMQQMYQLEPRVQVVIEVISNITLYELDLGQLTYHSELKCH